MLLILCATLGCSEDTTVTSIVDNAKEQASSTSESIKKSFDESGAADKIKDAASAAKDKINQVASNTQDQLSQATQNAQETLQLAGSFNIQTRTSSRINSGYATLTVLPGRPAVLNIRTAKDPSSESFPSALLTARVDVENAAQLIGKKIEGKLYLALKDANDVWVTDSPVTIEFTSANESKVSGRITGGELRHVTSGSSLKPSGEFVGVFDRSTS